MSEDEFWALIGKLRGTVRRRSVERLTRTLAKRPEKEILGFADRLAEALYRVDTPQHAARDLVDPESGASLGMSDDSFLYLRCGTVASGRKGYECAVADPAAMPTSLDLLDGEELLSVAPDAWAKATGLAWDHEEPVSYETGSNRDAWGNDDAGPVEPYTPPWLQLGPGYGLGAPDIDDQANALFAVYDAIRADPAWSGSSSRWPNSHRSTPARSCLPLGEARRPYRRPLGQFR